MDLPQFIGLAASAGIVSTVLTAMLSVLGHWWTRSRRARFFALRLAVLFERYAGSCTDRYVDHEDAESSDGAIGDYAMYLPPAPALPEDDDNWPLLNHDTTQRAFSFAGGVQWFNEKMRFNGEVVGDIDHDEVIAELFVTAEKALMLARDLRYHHEVGGIPENTALLARVTEWRAEHKERLARKAAKREERRLAREAKKMGAPGQQAPLV